MRWTSRVPALLQWDVVGRGKHNGFVKGVQYFTCPDGCGTFVRPETVIQPSISFEDAFIERYASADAASAVGKMDFREAGGNKAAVICELVGKEKELERLQKTADLTVVTLAMCMIARAGDTAWVRTNAAGIEALVLDDNLFRDWASVGELAVALPNLRTLSLNGNRLQSILTAPVSFAAPLERLQKLSINSTGADFAQMDKLVEFLPALSELHMANNRISTTGDRSTPGGTSWDRWPSLTLLDLSDNALSSWEQVVLLNAFGKLETLLLPGNNLPDITFGDEAAGSIFARLRVLSLANNKIQSLASLHALRTLAVSEVRMQGNPVCEGIGTSAFRQLVIAMVPSLVSLNGGEVRGRERTEAEKFYIGYWLRQTEAPDADTLRKHDTVFASLVEKHGLPAVRGQGGGGAGPSMLNVTLKSMAADSAHKAPVTRKLPAGMTVANVKRLCQQLFKLDAGQQRLYTKNSTETDMWNADLMEEDLKPISFYIGCEECDIVMQEVDIAVAQTEARAKEERKRLIEEAQSREQEALLAAQRGEVNADKEAAVQGCKASE